MAVEMSWKLYQSGTRISGECSNFIIDTSARGVDLSNVGKDARNSGGVSSKSACEDGHSTDVR